MAETIDVMIIGESSEIREHLIQQLDGVVSMQVIGDAALTQDTLQRLSVLAPDVILLVVGAHGQESARAVEYMTLHYPNMSVITLMQNQDLALLRQFMRAGAKDCINMSSSADQLVASIEEVYQTDRERSQRKIMALLSDQFAHRSRAIAFVSTKGGVGKTTIAVNVAAALAAEGKKVVFVDLDLQSGVAHLMLNVSPTRTLAELVQDPDEIDEETIERYLTPHESGLKIICAPKRPEQGELVGPADVHILLQVLRKSFDFVVVDTAPIANDVFFATLEEADECFLISTLNLTVLKNNRTLLELLQELDYGVDKVKHVLNRSDAKLGLKPQDVESVLKSTIYWDLESDENFVEKSINLGTPFVLSSPKHKLSRQVFSFTARLAEERGNRVSRRNFAWRLFRKRKK